MHATLRRYEGVDRERTDELTEKVTDSLMPRLSELPGFNGYYLIEAGQDRAPTRFAEGGRFAAPVAMARGVVRSADQ